MLITNDPWKTSGHLNDVTICTPVFRGSDCIAFFASTCHSADIGGHVLSAEAREVYEEGLFIPIMKLYEGGRPNESLAAIIRANTRVPDLVMGDFHAQMAGGTVGRRAAARVHGRVRPRAAGAAGRRDHRPHRAGHARGDRRAAARRLPVLDHLGRLRRADHDRGALRDQRGRSSLVDYTGSSPASRRGINVVMNYTEAYTTYGVKVIVSPDVPNNEGAFRVLRITAPEGSILNVRPPAPVAARHIVGHFLPHAIAGALGQALPDRVMAEGSANIWGLQVSGKNADRTPWVYTFFSSGGTGARPQQDGLSATAFPSGVLGTPVEVIEIARAAADRAQGPARRLGRRRPPPRRPRPDDRLPRARRRARRLLDPLRSHAASRRRGSSAAGPGGPGEVLIDGRAPANPKAEQRCARALWWRSGCRAAAATVIPRSATRPCAREICSTGTSCHRSEGSRPAEARAPRAFHAQRRSESGTEIRPSRCAARSSSAASAGVSCPAACSRAT